MTIVDEGDWQGAIAAAVLMAAPVRAPLLISTGGELPDPTAQALEALDPQGNNDTTGAQAFAIGDAPAPDGLQATPGRSGATPPPSRRRSPPCATSSSAARPPHIVLAPEDEPGLRDARRGMGGALG